MLVKMFQKLWELLLALFPYEADPGLSEDLLEVLYEDDGSHYETKRIDGVVTHLRETQSLAIINNDIYMDLSITAPGGKKLRLNDFIVAIVKRRCEDDAWTVQRVDMIERRKKWQNKNEDADDWQESIVSNIECPDINADDNGHFKCKTVVGQVTEVSNKVIVDKGKFELPLSSSNGIRYATGDWLTMKMLFDPEETDEKLICTSAEPLRKWKFEGRINILQENKGVIDNDIFFTLDVCMHGYTPVLKDFVYVTAIESDAGGEDFLWRAISVVPRTNNLRKTRNDDLSAPANLKDAPQISIEKEVNFGVMEIGSEKEMRIEINNVDLVQHTLLNVKFLNMRSNYDIRNANLPVIIPISGKIYIELYFKANTMGKVEDVVEFDFGNFIIERSVSAEVRTKESVGDGNPIPFLARFKQRQQISRRQVMEDESNQNSNWVMKGVRPFKPPPFTTLRLASYTVPRSLWQTIQQKSDLVGSNPSLSDVLGSKNYCIKFQTLLHLEEIETTMRLRSYDIERASLKPMGPYLALEVKGLAEKRPSLVTGDGVMLSNPWGGGGLSYEGFVHATFKSEALLQFHPDFHQKYDGEDYAVRFILNRTTLRRYHTAVEASAKHPGFKTLFPSEPEFRPPQFDVKANLKKKTVADRFFPEKTEENSVEWVNPCLNCEQRQAVLRILEGIHRPIPYIIYGPPGTGKTVTVVEAVLQVFLLCPRSRILIVTPSNSSADLIALRLHDSGKIGAGEMVRLNAFSRNTDMMPESIQQYSMTCENEDLQKAIRHRILVTTCTTSGKIYTMCLQIGHFTHLFIDEAGQATEPESLVPIGLIRCDSNPGQIVLAGDPKQLGPVLMSQHASSYGLNVSLLERLSMNPLYARNDSFSHCGFYNSNLLTKLVRNYRSHPALLTLPSFMFYENELVPCASIETAEKMAHFSWLPKPGIPLIFHGIRGENYQETDSPSWCNPAEVYHVIRYLQLLLNAKVNPDNVGVITPYRKQVEKIREFIKSNDLFPFKVGSVEEFQGQERDVIIVSTVRSHEYFVEQDVIQHLGFIRSPKRFNVTVTRAKSLLIVIGNPHLLIHDEHWGPFLKHCTQLGAYTGCDLPLL